MQRRIEDACRTEAWGLVDDPRRAVWYPGRLWSLWEIMQPFKLHSFLDAYSVVLRVQGRIENTPHVHKMKPGTGHQSVIEWFDAIKKLVGEVEALRLGVPTIAARRLWALAERGATYDELREEIGYVHRTIRDHFEGRRVLVVDERKTETYEAIEPLFGLVVWAKFQKSQRDIEESGKCLALRRNTAAVFHLMRAMEAALRALAGKIGVTVQDSNGQFLAWGVIVSDIKGKIPALPLAERDVWTEAHNLLWGVGKAWRNTTMHPAETYTDEEAETLFGAVKGFMGHLAPLV